MSYDIQLGVKVEGGDGLFATIDEPSYAHPTYNIGDMLRACTGWDFEQGEWYRVSDVLEKIEHGIHELKFNRRAYEKYNAENGWGDTFTALNALQSMLECIHHNIPGSCWTWNEIPTELLYVRW